MADYEPEPSRYDGMLQRVSPYSAGPAQAASLPPLTDYVTDVLFFLFFRRTPI